MTGIVHLTTVHPPGDTRILQRQCRSLAAAGYRVALIARDGPTILPPGVTHIILPPAGSRLMRMTVGAARALFIASRQDAALIHLHDPELIPIGLALKAIGRKLIYDVHEDVPAQMLDKPYLPVWVRPLVAAAIRLAHQIMSANADAIIVAEPGVAPQFPAGRTTVVQNFTDAGELSLPDAQPYRSRAPHFAYIGEISRQRGLFEMMAATARLSGQDAKLIVGGLIHDGTLVREARSRPGWHRTEFRGWLDRPSVGSVLAQARAGLVVLHPLANYVDAQPTKLFEYMMAGLPAIVSDFPRWRAIVQRSNCGILVDPLNVEAIAEAMRWLLEHPAEAEAMGQRGREAALRDFSWTSQERILIDLYRRLIGSPPG